MSDCFKKNELLIPGTRQDERLIKSLEPSYVIPDERSIPDLLVFISNYATLINYYAVKGPEQKEYVIEGNWKPLIMSDEAFNYAGIAVTPYILPNITFYKYVDLYETGSTTAKRHAAYRVLWDVLFSVYKDINRFYTALPVYMPLRNVIQTEISNNLVSDFGISAGAYLNDISAIPSLNLQVATSSADDDYKFEFADDLIKGGFDKIWIDAVIAPLAKEWNAYLAVLNPNAPLAQTFFNTAGLVSEADRIDYSTLQLKQIFKRAFETYARIIQIANEYLQSSLENNSSHFAHHGLMLAFLKLFGILQGDINAFTRKHLEYYYNRVLKINPAPPVPDSAHIVFEPGKNITSHLIKKSTALNAGKDNTGKLLLYNTDDELVISQAKVEQVKTLFLEPDVSSLDVPQTINKIYASPVAKSADGFGADFTGDDHSWKGFGDIRLDNVTGDASNVTGLGFYIASAALHLTEGNRVVDILFTTDSTGIAKANVLTKPDLLNLFSISFSGEKNWEPLIINDGIITDFNAELNYVSPVSPTTFLLSLTLLSQCKALVGYNPEVCAGNLNTIYPVIKFQLNQDSIVTKAYEKFTGINISRISITTTVSEVSNLSLHNDLGAVDASKPVQPFGPTPKKNSAFYIGHPELEFKMLSALEIKLKWMDYSTNFKDHYKYKGANTDKYYVTVADNNGFKAAAQIIRNKSWLTLNSTYPLFEDGETTVMSLVVSGLKNTLSKPEQFIPQLLNLNPQTQNGFIRLVLNTPDDVFGHAKWPVIFAEQTIAFNKVPLENTIPNPPYTPQLESITLKYVATQDIILDSVNYKAEQGQFFHLMPFGVKETNSNVQLLPVFDLEKKEITGSFSKKPLEGAVFIGIGNATINQSISLLVQVNEGTEDIAIDAPVIEWNYLSTSGWKNFDKSFLADSTSNLLKSGIVLFSVPVDIEVNATELPAGYLWVMAAIERDVLAPLQITSYGLPKLVEISTNAVKATFANNGNDPEHLAKALPAGTISKLFDSDAAVKKVNQPYASFGGNKTEDGKRFYTRVSERLRHKFRAITIWDYEKLVLNEFPEVYMVKCLNHTGYQTDCTKLITDPTRISYKENIPGQVMLVPVPYITNLQAGNIYQPTLSAAKLTDIKNFIHGNNTNSDCNKYIKALHCQLAKLFVENPKYETIRVTCDVKVKPCLDQFFYIKQLGFDLNNFLSPWINGDAAKINFGEKLHISQVIYFIEQLSYIDYVEKVTIEHKDGSNLLNPTDLTLAVATTSRSVLTSVGNDINGNPQHIINPI